MARPLRIEFDGALYHVTARGNAQSNIYLDQSDWLGFLDIFAFICERFNWVCYAYCLMSNHYHLLVETPEGNLSRGMRQLNGIYTQSFNRTHKRVGHVLQGRYKAILVQKESYLLELARYIVLNPVRAHMVRTAKDWVWSSYRKTAGIAPGVPWLDSKTILSLFSKQTGRAQTAYRDFVAEGKNQPPPWESLRNQIYLGDESFVKEMHRKIALDSRLDEIPIKQKRPSPLALAEYEKRYKARNAAIHQAYLSGGYKLQEIADHFGLHYSSVSKIVKNYDSKFKT